VSARVTGLAWLAGAVAGADGWARLPEVRREDVLGDARFLKLDRAAKLLTLGVVRALAGRGPPGDAGLVLGSLLGSAEADRRFDATRALEGGASPALFPATLSTSPASEVSIRLGLQGPVLSVSAGEASLLAAIGLALRALERGDADLMLACGLEVAAPDAARRLGRPGPFAESVLVLVLERDGAGPGIARGRGGAAPPLDAGFDLLGNRAGPALAGLLARPGARGSVAVEDGVFAQHLSIGP
jgi:hypothetical protein